MTHNTKKEFFIKVRVSLKEKETIQHKADEQGLSTSDYIRQLTLSYRLRSNPQQKEALRSIGRIASNINQLARQVNIYKDSINKLHLLTSLSTIEEEIKEIRQCI